jgi:hypothetical protein
MRVPPTASIEVRATYLQNAILKVLDQYPFDPKALPDLELPSGENFPEDIRSSFRKVHIVAHR